MIPAIGTGTKLHLIVDRVGVPHDNVSRVEVVGINAACQIAAITVAKNNRNRVSGVGGFDGRILRDQDRGPHPVIFWLIINQPAGNRRIVFIGIDKRHQCSRVTGFNRSAIKLQKYLDPDLLQLGKIGRESGLIRRKVRNLECFPGCFLSIQTRHVRNPCPCPPAHLQGRASSCGNFCGRNEFSTQEGEDDSYEYQQDCKPISHTGLIVENVKWFQQPLAFYTASCTQ